MAEKKNQAPAAASFETMRVEQLKPHPRNVRARAVADEEMVASVRGQGIHQPLVVAPHPTLDGDYTVIMGHRRLDAARKAGLDVVPVLVRHDLMDEQTQIAAMVQENLHRQDLSVAEEADAVQTMLDFEGWDAKRVAQETGLSARKVRARAKLTRLDDATFEKLQTGQLTLERAEVLADFAGQPEEEDLLEVLDVHPTNWDWHVKRARQSRDWRKKRPATVAAHEAAGAEVVAAPDVPVWRTDSPWQQVHAESWPEARAAGATAVIVSEIADEVTYVAPRPERAPDAAEAAREARRALEKEITEQLASVRELEDEWIRDTVLPAARGGDERTLRVLARHHHAATRAYTPDVLAHQAAVLGLDKASGTVYADVRDALEGRSLVEQAALWAVCVLRVPLAAWMYGAASARGMSWLRLRAELGWDFTDPEVRAVRDLAGEDGPDRDLAALAGLDAEPTTPADACTDDEADPVSGGAA